MYIGDQLSAIGPEFHGISSEQKKQVTKSQKYLVPKYKSILDTLYGNFLVGIYGSKPLTNSEQATAINNSIQTFNLETGEVYSKK